MTWYKTSSRMIPSIVSRPGSGERGGTGLQKRFGDARNEFPETKTRGGRRKVDINLTLALILFSSVLQRLILLPFGSAAEDSHFVLKILFSDQKNDSETWGVRRKSATGTLAHERETVG